MELTSNDKMELFEENALLLFRLLIDEYGYDLNQVKTIYDQGHKWLTHHIYINQAKNLKIIIKQEPCYTDYGFSFFIFNLKKNEYNILYHVPHEEQRTNFFLEEARNNLFSVAENTALISGQHWNVFSLPGVKSH